MPAAASGAVVPAKKEEPQKRQGLLSVVATVTGRLSAVLMFGKRIYSWALPWVVKGFDYAWVFGSTALLLSLPVIVEIQRETTVMVLQKQREQELAQMQEQVRLQNASTLDNVKSIAGMVLSGGAAGGKSA